MAASQKRGRQNVAATRIAEPAKRGWRCNWNSVPTSSTSCLGPLYERLRRTNRRSDYASAFCTRVCGVEIAGRELTNSGELACYDGLAANLWALNSAVECHLHTVEVIGSNPIAPTIFSSTCRLCSFGFGVIWSQLLDEGALCFALRRGHRLDITVHCDADIRMAHERLHRRYIFPHSI